MMVRMVMMVSRCETETSSYAEVLSTSDDECRNQNGSSSAVLCNTRELCALHMYILTFKERYCISRASDMVLTPLLSNQ